jgi:segregation and condensation protein A
VKDPSDNIVITFISLLELARLKRINVFQNEDRSTIYINVVRSLEDFDVDQANGFEDEALTTAPEDMVVSGSSSEKLVIEDLGEYTEEIPEAKASSQVENEEDYLEKYGELLTTPDSLDEGAKLIQ